MNNNPYESPATQANERAEQTKRQCGPDTANRKYLLLVVLAVLLIGFGTLSLANLISHGVSAERMDGPLMANVLYSAAAAYVAYQFFRD